MEPRKKCSNCQRTATLESPHGLFCTPACASAAWEQLPVDECARLRAVWAREELGDEAPARSQSMTRLAAQAVVPRGRERRQSKPQPPPPGDAAEPVRVRVDAVDLCAVQLSREDKGRAWWTALHSMAFELEDDPATGRLEPRVRAAAEAIANALTIVYPCAMCRAEYAKMHADTPPVFVTAEDARQWFCDRHNQVKRRLAAAAAQRTAAPGTAGVGADAANVCG